jgi:hypothetical protein
VGAHAVCQLLAFLFGAISTASAQSTWTLVTSDFQSRPASLSSIDDKSITASVSGSPQTFSWDSLLELDHVRPVASSSQTPAPFTLYLNGGDRLKGAPLSIADDTLSFQQSLLGKMDIPEDRINAIVRAGQSAIGIDQPRKADVVRLLNGDTTTGIIQGMDASSVSIRPADADAAAQIGLDKVAAILLADADPLAAPSGRAWRVWLSDDSSLTAPSIRQGNGASKLTVGISDKKTTDIDLNAVTSIEQTNGPVRWLTGLTPTEIVYHPFFDESFPPQFDHPVDDPSASIRQLFPPFRHGIGVHSYTKLTYAVPDGCRAFRAQYAVEQIAGADMVRADLTVRILADGKPAAEFTHVRFGKVSDPVTVDVTGKKEISLEVDYGDNLAAQGRLLWLDPAFLTAAPATGQ